MTSNFDRYYANYDRIVRSLDEFDLRVTQVRALADRDGSTFYWRGQADARWGVHSSLHRALARRAGAPLHTITEDMVIRAEEELVAEGRDWVRPGVGARLTTVDLLARLQHHGVPTRLIDFTSDPLVALYFAVVHEPDQDGRIVVAAAQHDLGVQVHESFKIPWARRSPVRPSDWDASLFALLDQQDFLRITRQHGVFIVGGTPTTRPHRRGTGGKSLSAIEVRTAMSVPLALHSWAQAEAAQRGTRAKGPRVTYASAMTLRIDQAAKAQIRAALEGGHGITMATLFPDPDGFRENSPLVRPLLPPRT